jgi:hypothetical protein
VSALTHSDLSAIIPSLGQSAKDVRDAAILLVGFAGAFRRSELAAMEYQQIEIGEHGGGPDFPEQDRPGRPRSYGLDSEGAPVGCVPSLL